MTTQTKKQSLQSIFDRQDELGKKVDSAPSDKARIMILLPVIHKGIGHYASFEDMGLSVYALGRLEVLLLTHNLYDWNILPSK